MYERWALTALRGLGRKMLSLTPAPAPTPSVWSAEVVVDMVLVVVVVVAADERTTGQAASEPPTLNRTEHQLSTVCLFFWISLEGFCRLGSVGSLNLGN